MFSRSILLVAPLFLLVACAPRWHRANELVEKGKYVEAAEFLEQLAASNPKDPELPQLVIRARQLAVEQTLQRAREARLADDPETAQRHLAAGLALRTRWNVKLSGALESTIEDEREAATRHLRLQARSHVERGEGLALGRILTEKEFLLVHPELASIRSELESQGQMAGQSRCELIRPAAVESQPYLRLAIARYCAHFQQEAPSPVALPDTFREAQVRLAVTPSSPLVFALESKALEALSRSPWRSELGPLGAELVVEGRVDQSWSNAPIVLAAGWTERVPYKEKVKKTVEDTVPVTECEAYDEYDSRVPGGKIQKVREVTRKKTVQREVYVEETRWRNVPRVFEFSAIREERTLSYAVNLELSVNGEPLGASGVDARDSIHGHTHDARFDPAGVQPSRAAFPAAESWIDARNDELVSRFSAALRSSWRARFCVQSAYTPEEAARCARAVTEVPKEVSAALEPLLGSDASLISRLLD